LKLDTLKRRIAALEPMSLVNCPHCRALEALADGELNELIDLLEGRREAASPELSAKLPNGIPESSSTCPVCQKGRQRIAAMTDEELDIELERAERLDGILRGVDEA
jgi:hypothetical protein